MKVSEIVRIMGEPPRAKLKVKSMHRHSAILRSFLFAFCSLLVMPAMANIIATGGTVSQTTEFLDGAKMCTRVTTIYSFTNPAEAGSITFDEATTVDVLVVGGGAGGGGRKDGIAGAGGGGGGEVVYRTGFPVMAGTYPVTVGAGGAGRNASHFASDGGVSSIFSLSALGGCASTNSYSGGASGNGNVGGTGTVQSGYGGGGGAGGSGTNANGKVGGSGGNGVECAITGESRWYGGGGGGGSGAEDGTGGFGVHGGGNGGVYDGKITAATPGVDGTGGGGGGAGQRTLEGPKWPAAGGSGTVIVRIHKPVKKDGLILFVR